MVCVCAGVRGTINNAPGSLLENTPRALYYSCHKHFIKTVLTPYSERRVTQYSCDISFTVTRWVGKDLEGGCTSLFEVTILTFVSKFLILNRV